jgi:hypothetical protein
MSLILIALLSLASLVLLNPDAAPPPPAPADLPDNHAVPTALFETADRCMACHNGVSTSTGGDVSIGFDWRASMMANAARDPYWQAAVRRETLDHPGIAGAIEDKCATCHMPMARYEAHMTGGQGGVFANLPVGESDTRSATLAADGASCSACHQIQPDGLGDPSSFTGGFKVDESTPWGERAILGPFQVDSGRESLMQSATGFIPGQGVHIQASEVCASCHTLYTHAYDDEGNEVGELPEQVPYLEWRESAYAQEGRSCQSCHMPLVPEPVPVTRVLGQPRDDVSRHVFRGGNFFMLGMLNRYRDELGVEALPQELDAAVGRTVEHLQARAARITVDGTSLAEGELSARIRVENRGGHKLPTAYPSRRAWLHITVKDGGGGTVFESGAFRADGSIEGNDNDVDGARYEPHHRVITTPDQVQIWESVMVDWRDRVTTGLSYGVRFVKDNRILPRGFGKGSSHQDVAVHGDAIADEDFTGGADDVLLRIPVSAEGGPFAVEVELWYQPIGYRWARSLGEYDSFESERFAGYYDAMAGGSAVVLEATSVRVR